MRGQGTAEPLLNVFTATPGQIGNLLPAVSAAIDAVGEFSLALFVSMSIISMKLWQLSGLGMSLIALLVAQIVLIVLFAYFYTSITFNPLEIANNMKKQGGMIPFVRPGKPTTEYLTKILNYVIFIGAAGLVIVCIIPLIISGVFKVSRLSFTGTSLIIIVGVILETIKAIESQMLVRNYRGFLSE